MAEALLLAAQPAQCLALVQLSQMIEKEVPLWEL
jgi:hypothetical protein